MLAAACLLAACARTEPGDQTALGSKNASELSAPTQSIVASRVLAEAGGVTLAASQTKGLPPLQLMREDLRATGLDLVYFAGDSSTLTSEGEQTLIGQIAWLKQHQVAAIVIEGHADERGTREYNIALGARRATAVREFLISQGVAPDRVATRSYGREQPIVSCDDIICWSQNRRAQAVPTLLVETVRSAQASPTITASRPW
jgi:peptidoglycan-associated lipoprotein